jgi:lantibiotic modifying enzyme
VDHDLAQREIDLRRAEPPLDKDEWFARYLALHGITEEELREILGEPVESLAERIGRIPGWLSEIENAYRRAPRPIAEISASLRIDPERTKFLDAVEPLVRNGYERLGARIADLGSRTRTVPFDPSRASDLFLVQLLTTLQAQVERVFVLELNVARMQGELEGETSAERFECFVRRMRKTESALAFLAEYPVLARRLVETIDGWERASFELLQHLCADRTNLWAAFSPERDPGRLVRVGGGAGDVHRGGRSVAIVEFESGLRVVYKPRSLAVDVHFQELLAWLNEAHDRSASQASPAEETRDAREWPGFRMLRVLDRGDHGWVEFVESRACTSREEVTRFYWRQGAYLALLHALEAVDFHFENLIADGEHPLLVDLETLVHPRLPVPEQRDADLRLVHETTSRSVLRTGLLPHRAWSEDGERPGPDVSGLGGAAGELAPDALLHWQAAGTDEMRATRERVPLPAGKNAPVIEGETASALEHVEDIVRGFEDLARLLIRRRDELCPAPASPRRFAELPIERFADRRLARSGDGPLERFARDEVRVVLRPTRAYGLLLSELTHPDLQRDALELEMFLAKLWVGVDEAPHMAAAIGAEHLDLEQGDIPRFATSPASRDLVDSRGERHPGFFSLSGLELVDQRLHSMSEADIERQTWFIRSAFATSAVKPEELRWPKYRPIDPLSSSLELGERGDPGDEMRPSRALREQLIARARRVGDRLDELALRDADGDAAWIGFKFEHGRWELVPLPDDLYSGILGVAHFLAYLALVTKEERYSALAKAALAPLRRRVRENRTNLGTIGAFSGLGGIVYTFAHLGRLWNDDELLREAAEIAELAASRIDADEDLDIIGGAGGFIGALASLHRVLPSERWIEIARRCGEHLVTRAIRMEHGVGWSTRIEKNRPATGYSHGASGIAAALVQVGELTHEARYRALALEAVAYEASQFDAAAENWLDPGGQSRNTRTQDGTLMVAWCYGAPGVGLARLALSTARTSGSSEIVGKRDPPEIARIARDLEIAIQTTRKQGFGRNHSLCHGDLGNLEFLAQAARFTRDFELARFVREKTATVLASIERDGVLCGMPLGIESVALMNGLAGVGFGLLRLAEPERVPSVLTLDAPA